RTFLTIFSRDRQAIFFSLLFPVIFMSVFALVDNSEQEPITIGIVDQAGNTLSAEFIAALDGNPVFAVTSGEETALREALVAGEQQLVLVIPEGFNANAAPATLRLIVDAAQTRELGLLMPVLEQSLVQVERELRGSEALFTLAIEDVQARSQSYLDFLVPGLLAFTIMQISISGSGYNIVEYRRKGILKRLFVTPIRPAQFIGGLVLSRSLICLIQLSLL